jgi:catechol 2,3-dioxygenase-like lactoylglutathione lyase family enzyme
MADMPAPAEGIVLTHFLVSSDVARSRRFYADILGAEVLRDGEPSILALANAWIIINVGGEPTEDKPTVTLEPPTDLTRVGSFLNIRVADCRAIYEEWSARGGRFLTPPADLGSEIRCYLRDPDGYLIEVGQHVFADQLAGKEAS